MTLNRSNFQFRPRPTGSVSVLPYPYIGFVRNNTDPQFMGRLGVWIPELCGDPLDQSSWILCSYCSPFAGATNINELENYQDKASQTVAQQSYGWVSVPPDINSEVMVIFAGGDISRAYWIGCTYQQNMNHMVPGIAADTTYPGQKDLDGTTVGTVVPVIEYNKASVTGSPTNVNRPIFQPLTTGLDREGLMTDLERGPASTSMRREAPPLMSGWVSPRGNAVHIDDAAINEFIRFRTRSGTQILIHETTGYVYINSKDGNSWFEISDAGIDGFTAQSISLRAMNDINLIAGKNIVLDAGANINARAGSGITAQAGKGIDAKSGTTINLDAGSVMNLNATRGIDLSSAAIQVGASGNLTMSGGGNVESSAGGKWARKGSPILDNSGAVRTADPAATATVPQGKKLLDVTAVQSGSNRAKWTPGGGQYDTIAARMPTHEPWTGHPNANIPPIPTTTPPPYTGPGTNTPSGSASKGATPDACSYNQSGTNPIGTVSANAIANASSVTGVDQATLLAFSDRESKNNPNAINTASNAAGLFQFLPSTWAYEMGKHGNELNIASNVSMTDPVANSLLGAAYIKDNATILQGKGMSADAGNLYLMHYMGPGAAPKFIQAVADSPDASAASLFPTQANSKGNHNIYYNADGSSKTVAQVNADLTNDIKGKAQAYATQNGLPAPCQRPGAAGGSGPSGGVAGTRASEISHKIDPLNAITSAQPLTGKFWWKGGSGQTSDSSNRQCVALLQSELLNLPVTGLWRRGQGNLIANPPTPGQGIATFDAQGEYHGVAGAGTTHAAIYLGPNATGNGFMVLEQYNKGVNPPAHIKEYKAGDPRGGEYDANNYHVINFN
jgi:phage gp45-like